MYSFKGGELYTATVSDFSGSDPLIYKEPLRTEQYDSKILNGKKIFKIISKCFQIFFSSS